MLFLTPTKKKREATMVKTMLLTFLRTLIILLFSMWIILWFLKPTNFWTKIWRRVEDSIQISSFKYNGFDFLVYVFPIILLTILALIFMYFQPRSSIRRVRRYLTALYNPVIVKTPLGMLSGIDVIYMSLVLTLLVWTFYARISNDYNKLVSGKHHKLKIGQVKLLKVSTRFGLMAEICLAFLIFPVLRELSVFRMIGVQFEASVRYHIWVGTMLVFFAMLHGIGTLFIWGINHQIQTQIWSWEEEGLIHLAGVIAFVTLMVIWASSLPLVRRNKFELFYYMHHLYVVFIVLFLFHAGDRHFYMVFAGVFLFAIDKFLRIIHSNPKTFIHSMRIFPTCKTIELSFPKDPKLSYTPTSIIFIKIPMISKFQWHPFSIASSSTVNDHTISVMIKCVGCWTNSLYKILCKEVELNSSLSKCIPVALEGPYGPASFDFIRYDNLLFIAGGIGISPILSILQEISSTKGDLSNKSQPQHLHLVYVTKKSQEISLLTPISHLLLNQNSEFHHLKVTVFVTQEQKGGSSSSLKEQLTSFSTMPVILFDIKNSNSTYTLGIGWLNPVWMGAITGFSSVIFFLSISFFNLFLFAPKQKKPKPKSPSLVVDLCMMCSLLIAVACGALVAMVLRWRNSRKEGEVQSTIRDNRDEVMELSVTMEGASTNTLEEHEIHYGARPIFKDLVPKKESEFRGSNMGVVVCGPEAMKESVASACHEKCRQPLNWDSKHKEDQHYYAFHSLNFSL